MGIATKVIIGVAMAVVLLVVAAVTLAITYSVSINAIRTAGQRLAGSVVDTVSTRVGNYINTTEETLWNVVKMTLIQGYVLPTDETSPTWYMKWTIPMRTLSSMAQFSFPVLGVVTVDGGLVAIGEWWVNTSWVYAYVLDPKSLPVTGLDTLEDFSLRNRLTNAPWNSATMGAAFSPPSLANQSTPWLSMLRELSQGTPYCYWAHPVVVTTLPNAPPAGAFYLKGACSLINSSGTFLGEVYSGRTFADIGSFLQGAGATPNTQMFLIDSRLLIIASSYSAPFTSFYSPQNAPQNNPGCTGANPGGSSPPLLRSTTIGCLSAAAAYNYAPLADIAKQDPSFLNLTTRDERYGNLAGATFFYISVRISTMMELLALNLILFMPESDVLGGIAEGTNIAIIITVAVFAFAAILANLVVHLVLPPLDLWPQDDATPADYDDIDFSDVRYDSDVSGNTTEVPPLTSSIGDIELQDLGPPDSSPLEVSYRTMLSAIRAFNRYFPSSFIRSLVATNQICDIPLRPIFCTIMFIDLSDLRVISERTPSRVVSSLFRLYFDRVSRIIMGHGGVIDRFVGDCIMAVWSAPVQIDRHELRAAVCGRMVQREAIMDPLHSALAETHEVLDTRIGIATGELMVGSAAHVSYTVMGDDVNLASRLLQTNRNCGTQVLVAQVTADACKDWLVLRHVVSISASGRLEPVPIYEVIGVKPGVRLDSLGDRTVLGFPASPNNTTSSTEDPIIDEEDEDAVNLPTQYLVRRAMLAAPVAPGEAMWAEEYTSGYGRLCDRDYAGCLQVMRSIMGNPAYPPVLRDSPSVKQLAAKCHELLTGVIPARVTTDDGMNADAWPSLDV